MHNNLFDISDKVVVITGGSGVLGGNLAEYLLSAGAKVGIIGHTPARVEARLDTLKGIDASVLGFTGDVLDEVFLQQVKDALVKKWKHIDVLINMAGGNMPGATIDRDQTFFDLKMDDFRSVAELNLDGTVIPSLVFGKQMAEQGQGCIINVSSMTASRAVTRVVGYSAAKAAIENFTRWLATELAQKYGEGLRVNAVAPGFFISTQNRDLLLNKDGSYTERGKAIITHTPMKRFGHPDELNGALHWLMSNAASFVTGTIVPIDGGFNAFSGV